MVGIAFPLVFCENRIGDGPLFSFGERLLLARQLFPLEEELVRAVVGGLRGHVAGAAASPRRGTDNVDPAAEMTQLMDAQRQLEANANMIKYQDQTLGRLVNDVGKIT